MYQVAVSLLPSVLNFVFNLILANRFQISVYGEINLIFVLINGFVLAHNRWMVLFINPEVDGSLMIPSKKYIRFSFVLITIAVFALVKSTFNIATVIAAIGLTIGLCTHEINKRSLIISGDLKNVLFNDVVKSSLMCVIAVIVRESVFIIVGSMLIINLWAFYSFKRINKKRDWIKFCEGSEEKRHGFPVMIPAVLGPMLFIAYQSLAALLVKIKCGNGDLAYLGIISLFLSVCNPFVSYLDNFVLLGKSGSQNIDRKKRDERFKRMLVLLLCVIAISAFCLQASFHFGFPSVLKSMNLPLLWYLFFIFSAIYIFQNANSYISAVLQFKGALNLPFVFDVFSISALLFYVHIQDYVSILKIYVVFLGTVVIRTVILWIYDYRLKSKEFAG